MARNSIDAHSDGREYRPITTRSDYYIRSSCCGCNERIPTGQFRMRTMFCVVCALLQALSMSVMAEHGEITAKVIDVSDGDTFTIDTSPRLKVRLANIDAPELKQDYGINTLQSLSNMVLNKTVRIEFTKMDGFGRILGEVSLDGRNVALEQVKNGLAWAYVKYGDKPQEFVDAESYAKGNHIGLWAQENPTPPWESRKKPKDSQPCKEADENDRTFPF